MALTEDEAYEEALVRIRDLKSSYIKGAFFNYNSLILSADPFDSELNYGMIDKFKNLFRIPPEIVELTHINKISIAETKITDISILNQMT